MRPSLPLTLALIAAAACTGPMEALKVLPSEPHRPVPLCDAAATCRDEISLQYLGVGGFVIRTMGSALMTAPSFTNPRMLKVIFPWKISPDEEQINEDMAKVDVSNVRAILVGHSHYDHLMDVPYVAQLDGLRSAWILGTPAVKHVLAGDAVLKSQNRVLAFPVDEAGTSFRVGTWYYVPEPKGPSRFRVMPVQSTHAPNFWRITIAWWGASSDRGSLPWFAWTWPKGEVYAYIIDVIRPDSSPAFRVFYQDAASDPSRNILPPFEGPDARTVDLAILCGGNFAQTTEYPTVLLGANHPRYALVGHWENFFHPPDGDLGVIPLTNTEELERRMKAGLQENWGALRPFDRLQFLYSYVK